MESPNTVVFPLVREQDVPKPLPYPLAIALAPHRNINVFDLIDSDQSHAKVVKAETTFNKVGSLFHILNPQGYPKLSKTPLQLLHPPLCSLVIGEY